MTSRKNTQAAVFVHTLVSQDAHASLGVLIWMGKQAAEALALALATL